MILGSSPVAVTSPSDFAPASSKEFLDIQATIECGFTLKRACDMNIQSVNQLKISKQAISLVLTTQVNILMCERCNSKILPEYFQELWATKKTQYDQCQKYHRSHFLQHSITST